MAIIATKPNSNGTYTPAPEGVHDAVCCDVADLGIVETTWQGETKSQHKVRLVWQLAKTIQLSGQTMNRRSIFTGFTLNITASKPIFLTSYVNVR